jgi:predicted GNAT superfamily acetyltransferase
MGGRGSAWELARAAGDAAGVSLVPLNSFEEARQVSGLAGALWEEDAMPPAMVRAFQLAGTGMYGARADGRLVGFVLAFLGLDEGIHMHSHMLGVISEWQSRGVGYALKLAQRAACLDAGIREVRWTYDPLVARNAWFNLVKLGAVATQFLPAFYGEMTDRINRGDRSDRFEVRWPLTSKRVDRALSGRPEPPSPGPVVLEAGGDPDDPRPSPTGASPDPGAVVTIPRDHLAVRLRDPDLGRAWRDASGAAFQACFAAGLVASWIDRYGRYTFTPSEEALR